jgi:hypothetical protein
MSRRIVTFVSLVATSSLVACADAATAPRRSIVSPLAGPSRELIDPGTCRGGWSASEGRCL